MSGETKLIVVLGGSGYLGKNLIAHFHHRSIKFINASRSAIDLESPGSDAKLRELVKKEEGAAVIFLAGIPRRKRDDIASYTKMMRMSETVAAAISREPGSRLVFTSTVDVYGCNPALPITEETETVPETWYARSKLESESILREAAPNLAILRLPGFYGEAGDEYSLIARLEHEIFVKGTRVIAGREGLLRDLIHVSDVCKAIEISLRIPQRGIWNVATGEPVTMRQIVDSLVRSRGLDCKIDFDGQDIGRGFDLVFDVSKLRRDFGDIAFRLLVT